MFGIEIHILKVSSILIAFVSTLAVCWIVRRCLHRTAEVND